MIGMSRGGGNLKVLMVFNEVFFNYKGRRHLVPVAHVDLQNFDIPGMNKASTKSI